MEDIYIFHCHLLSVILSNLSNSVMSVFTYNILKNVNSNQCRCLNSAIDTISNPELLYYSPTNIILVNQNKKVYFYISGIQGQHISLDVISMYSILKIYHVIIWLITWSEIYVYYFRTFNLGFSTFSNVILKYYRKR